jgi:hypothetical protein
MRLTPQQEHIAVLRHMLAELMTRRSLSTLTEEQRTLHAQGIVALQAAVDALATQVYA